LVGIFHFRGGTSSELALNAHIGQDHTMGRTTTTTTGQHPFFRVQSHQRQHCSDSFVSALTGAPTAPASRDGTRAFTFHFYIYLLLPRGFYMLSNHNISCNHDRQPHFGSNSDSKHTSAALWRKTPCTDMRQRRRAPSTTKRSPCCCPDVTDPPRAPSREGAQQQPSPPHSGRGHSTAYTHRHFPLPSLVQDCWDGPLAQARASNPHMPQYVSISTVPHHL
jgi:hypothetical protein